jgi:hypothetical protein
MSGKHRSELFINLNTFAYDFLTVEPDKADECAS